MNVDNLNHKIDQEVIKFITKNRLYSLKRDDKLSEEVEDYYFELYFIKFLYRNKGKTIAHILNQIKKKHALIIKKKYENEKTRQISTNTD